MLHLESTLNEHMKSLITSIRFATFLVVTFILFGQSANAHPCFATKSLNPPTPWSVSAGADVSICLGDTTQLQATGANSYTWTPSTGLSCTDCPNPLAFPTITTTYFVSGEDGTMDQVVVKVLNPPVIIDVAVNQPTECGLNNGSITITTLGLDPYQYSINGGSTWQNNGVFTALQPGNYSVFVRGSNGICVVNGGDFTLSAPPFPQILDIQSTDPSDCDVKNGNISVFAQGGISPLQYSIDAGQTWQVSNTFQFLGSGIFQIRVRNANGSCVVSNPNIALNGSPAEAIIADVFAASPSNCDELDGLITVIVPNDGGQFEYSMDGGGHYQPSNGFTGLGEGVYHILVRRSADSTCVKNGGYVTLTSNNHPTFYGVSAVNPQGCGSFTGNITILAYGPSTLNFSIDGGTTWHPSNIFSNLPAGTYTTAVQNSDGTCLVTGSTVILTQPAPPVIGAVAVNNPTACGFTDGSIIISAAGFGQLEYSINNGGAWQLSPTFSNIAQGSYTVRVRFVGGNCPVDYIGNPVMLVMPGAVPSIGGINRTQPSACGVADGSIAVLASGTGPLSYSINGGTSFQPFNVFNNLPAGDYPIMVVLTGTNCSTTAAANLVYSGCTDTVQVTITGNTNTVYCMDPAVFNNLGTITSSLFCNPGSPLTVNALSMNQNCLTLSPAFGFTGISPDLICTIHCFNNSSTCDTTYLQVTVTAVQCDDVFQHDTVTVNFLGNPTNYCVPVPLTDLLGFDLYLNGNALISPFACDFEATTAYSYTFLPGAGFSGPYSLDAWAVNGFTYSGFFNDANGLLLLMQAFDPSGNWQINTGTGLIFGGDVNTSYDDMQVTHLPSGTQSILNTNTTFLPTGFTVGLSDPGISVLIVQNPANGCADTLYINAVLNPIFTDTIYLTTTVNTPTISTCLDGSELPGGVIVNVGYCAGPANGAAPLTSPSCVFYIPNLNFAGQDQFCMVFCDGGFPQVCDTTYFIVNVLPENDTVYLTIPVGETSVDTCLDNFVIELPGGITSADFCGINLAEISGTINGNCLEFNANGSFYGTTTVCVSFCSGGVCDENTIVLNIVPPVVCEEIFDQNALSFITPSANNSLCIPIPPAEIFNYSVTLDGVAYTQSFIPCGFANLAVYSFANLPAGPYTINAWTANGTLHSGIVANIADLVAQMNAWDPAGNWVLNQATQTIQGGEGGIYSNLVITPAGGAPQTLTVNIVQVTLGAALGIAGYGTHEVIVTAANGCADTVLVTFVQHLFSTDTLVFNTTPNTSVSQICGNTDELLGNLFSVSFCGLPANGGFVPVGATCYSYTPNLDFTGSDTFCVVFCDDNLVPVCDTFVFLINVGDPCPEIFAQNDIIVTLQNGAGEACLPIAPAQINSYQITLDGQPYTGTLTPCNMDMIYIYNFGQVFGQGVSGPYSVSWQANGQNFASVVQNMQELVAQMNGWDFAGNWNIEQPTFSIISTNDNGVYGNLIITHIATGLLSTLSPNFNDIPLGMAVPINGAGQHQVVVQNQVDGCADTLTINAVNGVSQLNIFTFEELPSNVECIDITGLPGTFQTLTVCGQPQNGTLNIVGNCFTFTPAPGFVGTNTACVVACDNLGNCDTTLLNITVGALCSLFDIFPSATQQIQVASCADIAAYCTPILLDSIGNYGVLDNGFPYTGGFVVCNGQFAQIALDTGFHEIIFVQMATGCQDTLLANVTCTTNNGCGMTAFSPLTIAMDDCAATAQFCVSVSVLDLPNYLITDNGAAFGGTIGICDLNGTTVGMTVDTGLHLLILTDTVKGCADTFAVNVQCSIIDDVTMDTTVEQGALLVLCLEDFGYIAATIDSVSNVCVSNGNASFTVDTATWCITVVGEVVGLDTLCFEVFIGDTSAVFTANISVTTPCPTFIPGGLLATGVPCSVDTGLICLPITFLELANKTLQLDGQPYTGPLLPCGIESRFILNYNALPSMGQTGPYIVQSWAINGTPFTGVFNTVQELAALMNGWDPNGNWVVVFDIPNNLVLVQGGDPSNVYSVMSVEQQLTGVQVVLGINTITVPTGVAIQVPIGGYTLTITDTVTLCSETAIVELVCVTSDVVTDTILLGAQDTFCLDLTELVGDVVSVTNICPGSNGETVNFAIEGNCVIYEGNEPGLDSACVVVCDDEGLCDTTYFYITVQFFGDSLPIAVDDVVTTQQGDVLNIPVLNNDTVSFLQTVNIITQPLHGAAQTNTNGTINYVPDPNYCDEDTPDSFTYSICNLFGCDTATVFVTVLCSNLQIFQAFSPNGDGKNEAFKINGLQNYPNHHLTIYNRWGELVYETTNYLSNWEGTYKDKKLPDGTYFYLLDLGDGQMKKGYVVILR